MNLVEEILFNLILILFPILIYFIYSGYVLIKNKKYNELLLCLILFTSLYVFLKYGSSITDNRMLLFCNIPIIVAYLKKKSYLGIILSIFVLLYVNYIFNYSILILSIKLIYYYIFYLISKKYKIKDNEFIATTAVIQGFFLSFEYFFINTINDVYMLIPIFLMTTLYYFITFVILYLSNFVDKMTSLFYQIKELEREKEIKNSLFKLTHEIKNPLAVCKGYLDMLDIENKTKLDKYIPIIKQEINRSLNIMNDFLEFSKVKIKNDVVDISVLLDDVYDSFKILNNSRNIKLIYNEKDDEIYINGDYDRLKQVILNLLKNSAEAIKDKGKIIIDSKIKNDKCIIIIEDNGIGMDKETLSQIKNLFYTTKKGGSGIGVSLSYEIIKAHKGKIEYYSKVDKGTKVEIELPYEKI